MNLVDRTPRAVLPYRLILCKSRETDHERQPAAILDDVRGRGGCAVRADRGRRRRQPNDASCLSSWAYAVPTSFAAFRASATELLWNDTPPFFFSIINVGAT